MFSSKTKVEDDINYGSGSYGDIRVRKAPDPNDEGWLWFSITSNGNKKHIDELHQEAKKDIDILSVKTMGDGSLEIKIVESSKKFFHKHADNTYSHFYFCAKEALKLIDAPHETLESRESSFSLKR